MARKVTQTKVAPDPRIHWDGPPGGFGSPYRAFVPPPQGHDLRTGRLVEALRIAVDDECLATVDGVPTLGPEPSGQALRRAVRFLMSQGEVVPRGHGVGMVGAQDPFPAGHGLLEQRDRLIDPADVPVGIGEIVPRA